MNDDHQSTPAPFARQAEALRARACKLQKKGVKEKIEALIKSWYPDYFGRFGDLFRPFSDPIHDHQPRTSLILWREQINNQAIDTGSFFDFGSILERRATWSYGYSGCGHIAEGLAALALFRGLEGTQKPGDRFTTIHSLTVCVAPQYAETTMRPCRVERYIDIETGLEWKAHCWQRQEQRRFRQLQEQQQQAAA
jgi:hypothetical protein